MDKLFQFKDMSLSDIIEALKSSKAEDRKNIFDSLNKEQVSQIDFKELFKIIATMPAKDKTAIIPKMSLSQKGEFLKSIQKIKASESQQVSSSVIKSDAVAEKVIEKPVTLSQKKLFEMTPNEIIHACNTMIKEHNAVTQELIKVKADVIAISVEKATAALVQAHKTLQDSPEELKSKVQAELTKARQNYDKAKSASEALPQILSKFHTISNQASKFISESISELHYGKGSDIDLYTDLQAWLVNNKLKDYSTYYGASKLKGVEGPQIFIDAHGNLITGGFANNFFSYDPANLALIFKTSEETVLSGETISVGCFSVTFEKQYSGIKALDGEITLFRNDLKVLKIEGKCQVFMVGEDPHGRVSINELGIVEIEPYVPIAAPTETIVISSVSSETISDSKSVIEFSASEVNSIKESKIIFMTKISNYIKLIESSQSNDNSGAASVSTVRSDQEINEASSALYNFVTDDSYYNDSDFSDLIGQVKSVLHME